VHISIKSGSIHDRLRVWWMVRVEMENVISWWGESGGERTTWGWYDTRIWFQK